MTEVSSCTMTSDSINLQMNMNQALTHFLRVNSDVVKAAELPIPLGVPSGNADPVGDLAELNHILISGETSSGKSNFIHCLIQTLTYKYSPEQIEFILIDPKRVEFNQYRNQEIYTSRVIDNAIEALDVLEEISARPQTLEYQIIIIDTFSDLAFSDMARFVNVIQDLTKGSTKRSVVISDSRLSPELFTQKLISCFDTRVCFRLADPQSATNLLGGVAAEVLRQPGDYLIYSGNQKSLIKYHCPLAAIA